jgi:hypothetical protein
MYVTFPALNDNMTSKREKAKWKTIDSFFTKPVSTEKKDSSDKIASTEEPISKESLPERIDDSEHASSVSTVTSKDNAPPYPDISSLPVWDELYQSALDLSEPFYIIENMPGRCGRQTTRANHPADTPKQYWKVSLYHALIDHMIMELELRLIKSENRFYAQYLLPRVIGNITNEQIATLYETYQTDPTCNVRRIQEGGRSKANTLEYNTSRSDANFTL